MAHDRTHRALRHVLRVLGALVVAVLIVRLVLAQVGPLDDARDVMGRAPIVSWRGWFASAGPAQGLLYALVAMLALRAAWIEFTSALVRRDPPNQSDPNIPNRLVRGRIWLLAWMLALLLLRAVLANVLGVGTRIMPTP